MAGAFAYTPRIWMPLAAAVFLSAFGLCCWRRRDVPAAFLLALLSLFLIFSNVLPWSAFALAL